VYMKRPGAKSYGNILAAVANIPIIKEIAQ
jgi:hypothetical protein